MADPADIGNDRAEQQLGDILAARQKPGEIVGSAACLHCGEAISQDAALRFPQRWCDADCRNEWEKRHPSQRKPVPREPLPFSELKGRLRPEVIGGQQGGRATEGTQGYDLRTVTRQVESDEAKFMLRGHR